MSTTPFGPPPVTRSNPLLVHADYSVHDGSDVDTAPHLIPPGRARYIQDALLDVPGIVRQRGGVDKSSHDGAFPSVPSNFRPIGMASMLDPNGTDAYRIAVIGADYSSGDLRAYVYGRATPSTSTSLDERDFMGLDTGFDFQQEDGEDLFIDGRALQFALVGSLVGTNLMQASSFFNATLNPYYDAKTCLDGGVLIGIGMEFGPDLNTNHRSLWHWRGAGKPDYAAGTVTVTQNSTTVTGAGTLWSSNVEPGMFLTDTAGRFIGIVASVQGDTSIELEHAPLKSTTAGMGYLLVSFRKMFVTAPLVNVGTITTSNASTAVTGGGTKFLDQKLANGDQLFRASDYTYLGTVTSVQSNIGLTLTANCTLSLINEKYIAVPRSVDALKFPAGGAPVFSAYWNGMQFAANADNRRMGLSERSRIFILGPDILDAVDLTTTGSFYDLPSVKPHTDIRDLHPTESTVLVFLGEETYGLFGNTPDNLVPKLILNDGTLSPMAVQPWEGGVIWPGHRGVYHFDGGTVKNIFANRAAMSHAEGMADIDYSKYRAWGMVHRNHYVCFLEKVNAWPFDSFQGRALSTEEGASEQQDNHVIYCVNLISNALTFWTNVAIRGFTHPPGRLDEENDAYYMVENRDTNGPAICSAESLFADNYHDTPNNDEVMSNPAVASGFAPHFYIESRLYDLGDPQRLKTFKQFQVQHSVGGAGKLGVDIITGLDRDTRAMTPFAFTTASLTRSGFKNRKKKFSKRGTHVGFRLYAMRDVVPTIIRVGTWAFGAKLQRAGRV